jgi:hypothetical protein
MDNNSNINNTIQFINTTYDKLSYFDLYGNSVIIFIFITLLVFIVFSFCKIMQTKESVADDWVNQRCKPQNMLFAGFITKPEGTTSFQYTSDNFQFCVQNILTNIAGYALEPFHYMIKTITQLFVSMSQSIQKTREVTKTLRDGVSVFSENVFNRIMNVMIPMQKMFIGLMDTFQKIQGTMTGTLYTVLGSYYTLQALLGAILELIIKMLVALVVIIVGLWTVPFTWPAAASMSAVFLGISIPLSIIVYFMSEVLHIKSSTIPKLRCFDENTIVELKNGTNKKISEIELNDLLVNDSYVTAKIKVTSAYLDMYQLNGITISGCHIVKYGDRWIPVKKHPSAIKIDNYSKPYLYCLNTSNKELQINDITFTDWDEVYAEKLDMLINMFDGVENIHKKVDQGFRLDTKVKLKNKIKNIKDVVIGDECYSGGIVYGIVEIKDDLGSNLINLLVSNEIIDCVNTNYNDYNYNIDSILYNKK